MIASCVPSIKYIPAIREWTHFCLAMASNKTIQIFINETVSEYSCVTDNFLMYIVDKLFVAVGKAEQTSSPFSGLLADIRIYGRTLNKAEMQNISQFKKNRYSYSKIPNTDEDLVLDSTHQDVQSFDKPSYINTISISKNELLSNPKSYMLVYLSDTAVYQEANSFCNKIGGRLPDVQFHGNKTIAELIFEFMVRSGISFSSFWLATQQPVKKCNLGYFTSVPLTLEESNETCSTSTVDYFCIITKGIHLRLIGFTDYNINLYPVPYQIGVFESLNRYKVYLENDQFYIKDFSKNQIEYSEAVLNPRDIVGRHKWHNTFDATSFKEITLTGCNKEEFTCTDGACLPLSNVCNLEEECEDKSDELRFCGVGLTPSEFYDVDQPPASSSKATTILSVAFNILRIISINTDENIIKIDANLIILWQDPRLSFKFLSLKQAKLISEDLVLKFWRPDFWVEGAVTSDKTELSFAENKIKLTAKALENGSRTIIDSYEGMSAFVYNLEKYSLKE